MTQRRIYIPPPNLRYLRSHPHSLISSIKFLIIQIPISPPLVQRPLPIWTKLWLIGGFLVLLGVGIPALTVMHLLPASLLLLGGAAIASMIGVFLGYYAMVIYIRVHRPPKRPPDDYFHHEGRRQ